MQPLIKWPGGKASEFSVIKNFIPKYRRYVEPFFGGGAVYFNLRPDLALINDISSNLMLFYQYIKEQNIRFKQCLNAIDSEWRALKLQAEEACGELLSAFHEYRISSEKKSDLGEIASSCCKKIVSDLMKSSCIICNGQALLREIERMVADKLFRTRKNELKSKIDLADEDLKDNIVTGFMSGYYMYLRSVLNDFDSGRALYASTEYKIAVYYFIREFCYGAMFRYNAAGEFNIPYGGIAYNSKDFGKKIDSLFSEETHKCFANTQICCGDFQPILENANDDDFIFLDPPYDSDFSDYEKCLFREAEQRRLASLLYNTTAKFLLIIQNTPLIEALYRDHGFQIYEFDNQYSYCVKGRNDRKAVHLIITNY